MIDKSVARRYGKALFDIATEKDKAEQYRAELETVVTAIRDNEEFGTLILGRIITTSEKKELVQKVFANHISQEVKALLFVMLDKGREAFIPDALAAYAEFIDEAAGIVPVNVTAAISLEQEQADRLSEAFAAKIGKPVRLVVSVDEALIGGLKVQIGDTVYDGSIATQLVGLRSQLCK